MKENNKELKNFTDEELLTEIFFRSNSKKGLPIKEKCFKCSKDFWIKWNNTTQSHSKLHNFSYWSEKEKDKHCFICSLCLRSTYFERKEEFLKIIKDPKKINHLSSYISRNVI